MLELMFPPDNKICLEKQASYLVMDRNLSNFIEITENNSHLHKVCFSHQKSLKKYTAKWLKFLLLSTLYFYSLLISFLIFLLHPYTR